VPRTRAGCVTARAQRWCTGSQQPDLHNKYPRMTHALKSCRVSIVVSIPPCHGGDPGSIPGRGVAISWAVSPFLFVCCNLPTPAPLLLISQLWSFFVIFGSFLIIFVISRHFSSFLMGRSLSLASLSTLLLLCDCPSLDAQYAYCWVVLGRVGSFRHFRGVVALAPFSTSHSSHIRGPRCSRGPKPGRGPSSATAPHAAAAHVLSCSCRCS
jgi:hypothetical protein